MNGNNEKRMVADTNYEVKHAVKIGGCEVLLAENMDNEDGNYYLTAEYTENGVIGQYANMICSPDYLFVMDEFIASLDVKRADVQSKFRKADYQAKLIAAEDCYSNDYGRDITGEVVAIKASVLNPEYRRGDVQLVFVTHGSGARANPRGNSVYCYHLNDGMHTSYARHEVLGVIMVLPDWAKERLDVLQAERESKPQPAADAEKVGNYTITERIKVGRMLFVLGENPKAPAPYVTWQQMEGRSGYDLGHFLTDRDKAVADLHRRANNARLNLSLGKGRRLGARSDAR